MLKKYIVTLSDEERERLHKMITTGKAAARKLLYARILLKADKNGQNWGDQKIADALEIGRCTVERIRKRFVEEGLEAALNRRKTSRTYSRILDGDGEAHLVALVCSPAPDGKKGWTLRLLAEKMVALEYVDHICPETVRQALKKK